MTERPETVDGRACSRSLRSRLLALVLRPTARPLGWGIVVAVGLHRRRDDSGAAAQEGRARERVRRDLPARRAGRLRGLELRAGAGDVGGRAPLVYLYFHLEGGDSLAPALFVFLPLALLANVLAGRPGCVPPSPSSAAARPTRLAAQQAALRRVATLVARGADPADVYPVAVAELARGLDVEHVTLVEFEPDEHCTVLAAHDSPDRDETASGRTTFTRR